MLQVEFLSGGATAAQLRSGSPDRRGRDDARRVPWRSRRPRCATPGSRQSVHPDSLQGWSQPDPEESWYSGPMLSIKVSSKHQVSIPSIARRELGIEAGDRLSVEMSGDALILRRRPARPSERLRGLGKEAWRGVDPVRHVRELRDAGDRSSPPTRKRSVTPAR